MGTKLLPKTALLSVFVAMLLSVNSDASTTPLKAETAAVVVGSVDCLDCSTNDVTPEDAFKELQVAINCQSSSGEYETKALGQLDDTGAFRVPLAADVLSDNGELKQDCFAQLHSASDTPCTGQPPSKIASRTNQDDQNNTYLAVAADTLFSPVECHCKKKKKHFMFNMPPPRPEPPKPPTPTPSYGPPTPTPAPPVERPPTPEPIFHKHPKMKFMHKKKPCPPQTDEDPPQSYRVSKKLPKN